MNQKNLTKTVLPAVIITAALLAVPFIAMQFTIEVNWSISDFIIAAILVFSAACSLLLLLQASADLRYKAGVVVAIGTTFLLIWVNLAVGIIGSGATFANIVYSVVVAIVLAGTFLSRFAAKGLERTMFAAAGALVLITIVQLADMMHNNSVMEVLMANAFFAALFVTAALLFRNTASKHRQTTA